MASTQDLQMGRRPRSVLWGSNVAPWAAGFEKLIIQGEVD